MNHYQKTADCTVHSIVDEMILFKTKESAVSNNSAIVFNEAGTFLWNCLQERATKEELAEKLCVKYEINQETALKDTKEFLEKCVQEGIIIRCEA